MQFCKACNIKIHGYKRCCPLCQGELTGETDNIESYPYIEKKAFTRSFFVRLMICLAILSIIIPLFINLIFPTNVFWAYFVIAGVLCVLATIYIGITYRKKICHNISLELFFISVLSVIWDKVTGSHGWSLTYVLPICIIISLLSVYIISQVLKQVTNEHTIYLGVNSLWGLVPLLLIYYEKVNNVYPSVICAGLSIILLCIIIVFYGKNVFDEIRRKLHM